MEGDFFKWLSIAEGFMIVCMLGWEIFWLRRMYQVLWNMPTAQQVQEMVEMIKRDRDSIRESLQKMSDAFVYGKDMVLEAFRKMFSLPQV
jgi:predicted transcriptional regulator